MILRPDADQEHALAHARGTLLLTGPAGTGKTTVLRERFARLLEGGADPERVFLVVVSRRAREEARAALLLRLSTSLPSLRVGTIHALALQVVTARFADLGYREPPRLLSAAEQFAKVQELLEGENPKEWPAYGSMLRLRGFTDEVRQLLLRAQEALVAPEEIAAKADAAGLTGWGELARFYRTYLDVLGGLDTVDYSGLVSQAVRAAEHGPPPFDHVHVDDYQDATYGVEALLAALAPETLVVAGNTGAHVFSFQGTTVEPLERFVERFPGAAHTELSNNHRAAQLVTLGAWSARHTSEEHAAVAREIRRLHVEDGVPWSELAVVVRRHGVQVAGLLRALDDAGVPRTVPEAGLPVSIEPAVAPYVEALRWSAIPDERDALIEPLLTSDLARLSPASARALVREARADGLSGGQALARWDAVDPAEAAALLALRETLERAEPVAGRSVLAAFRILWRELAVSSRLVREAEADPGTHRGLDAVVAFARAVERAGDVPTAEFLEGLRALEDDAPWHRERDAVRVLTAHATVGREFDTVVVVGAVEGDFPSIFRPEPMFDLQALERRISQSERNRLRLEDERRLFTTVASRARRRVLLTSSDVRGEGTPEAARSRFADELGLSWEPAPVGPFDEPISTREAAATWRRQLADHAAQAARRLAALEGLLALGADPGRWWFQREWTDTGHPLHETIRVSASRLQTFENCHLQFVLADELGLEGPAGYYAWVGHLVHRLIEDCEAGTIERSLEALTQTAHERWRPKEFPSRAVSDTFERVVTRVMLPTWFAEYGAQPALATEQRFEFEYGGATVVGYIDRIGGAGNGSQITDFKTGKKQWGKAQENLQLGVYYLAVNHAETLAPYRPVRAVELVFLKDQDKRSGETGRMSLGFTSGNEPRYREEIEERIGKDIAEVRSLYETETIRPSSQANCRFCSFKPLCPLHPEGREIFHEANR